MKNFRTFPITLALALSGVAVAQEAPEPLEGAVPVAAAAAPNVGQGASRIVQVDEAGLATLPALLTKNGGPAAISLRASEAGFEAEEGAQKALLAWVRSGGTVFLHNGAARAFGFRTVEARRGSNAAAGQLFGRARAALPFGAHPLLMDDGTNGTRRAPGADPTLLPGVNVVFYEMQEGDHLVQSHPAGTALLEASDLAGGGRTQLFAAALAPFGRGFAVFTPDFIDQKRGDGALFARNLLNLLASPRSRASGGQFVGVPSSAVENGAAAPDALRQALSRAGSSAQSSPALPAFGTAPAIAGAAPVRGVAPAVEAPEAEPRAEAVVLMSSAEARSYAALLARGGDRAAAAINLLRARLFLGRGEVENATRALAASEALAPNSAEIALWSGILQAGAAQNLNQSSPSRAQLVADAARYFGRAAGAPSILPASTPATANTAGEEAANVGTLGAAGGATIGGIPVAALQAWSVKLGQIAEVFALEPPLVQQFGTGRGAITVRAVAEDTSLRLIVPGAQALANTRAFGWHGDNEEILLFPTPESYLNYRRALGLSGPTVPLPAGAIGDVVGQRISMIALPSTPAVRRNPTTGQVTVLANRNGAANVLARLHSYVLLGAYDEGGRSPLWLQMGLENLINVEMVGATEVTGNNQILDQTAQAGGLLTPAQFGRGVLGGSAERLLVAQAQSASLMAFFYRTFGVGAVTETVQRLGMGQSIDEALQATTEGDQLALFQAWRDAQFGPRNFPNGG